MYIYIYIYICICILYTYISAYMHMYINIYIFIHIKSCIYISTIIRCVAKNPSDRRLNFNYHVESLADKSCQLWDPRLIIPKIAQIDSFQRKGLFEHGSKTGLAAARAQESADPWALPLATAEVQILDRADNFLIHTYLHYQQGCKARKLILIRCTPLFPFLFNLHVTFLWSLAGQ